MPTLEAAARRLKPPAGLPRLWLFSDPVRLPDPLPAARRLDRGAGVVARSLSPDILESMARLARARGLRLLVAGAPRAALRMRAGLHLPDRESGPGPLPFLLARRGGAPFATLTLAVHGRLAAARRIRRLRPDLIFLSPAFPTASHPGAPVLGPLRWARLARRLGVPAAALGGVGPATAARLPRRAAGLAAIGALSPRL